MEPKRKARVRLVTETVPQRAVRMSILLRMRKRDWFASALGAMAATAGTVMNEVVARAPYAALGSV